MSEEFKDDEKFMQLNEATIESPEISVNQLDQTEPMKEEPQSAYLGNTLKPFDKFSDCPQFKEIQSIILQFKTEQITNDESFQFFNQNFVTFPLGVNNYFIPIPKNVV